MFAMHGDQGLPNIGAVKEALAVGDAPCKLDGIGNLRHRRANETVIMRQPNIVEAQPQQSGALASSRLGKGGAEFWFAGVCQTANRNDRVGALGAPCLDLRSRKNSDPHFGFNLSQHRHRSYSFMSFRRPAVDDGLDRPRNALV
jgi:hypothetical protein